MLNERVRVEVPDWLRKAKNIISPATGVVVWETDKAVLLEIDNRKIWLPKSQIKIEYLGYTPGASNTKPIKLNKPHVEKLRVEFEVEGTIKHKYGYEEKLLRFRGRKTKYKAIVKDGRLVAIVSRRYKLIPNEDVRKEVLKLAFEKGFQVAERHSLWRLYFFLCKGDTGVMVSNSVDGSIALRVDAVVSLNGDVFIPATGNIVQNIYRKHTENLKIAGLSEAIDEVYEASKKFRSLIDGLFKYKVRDYSEQLKTLLEPLPEIYTKGVISRFYASGTIKDLFEEIARRIWASNTEIETKRAYYRHLNNIILAMGVVDLI